MSEEAPALMRLGKIDRTDLDAELILDPPKTALVIVDMQYQGGNRSFSLAKFAGSSVMAEAYAWRYDRIEQQVVPNLQKLLAFFRVNRMKVAYLTVGSRTGDFTDVARHIRPFVKNTNNRFGAKECEVLQEIKPREGEVVFGKTTISGFASTPIDHYLRMNGIKHVIFTGVATAHCVDSNARAAADLGYHCLMVEDACSDARKDDHEWALTNFKRMWGRVASTEDVLSEMGRVLSSGR